MNSKPGVHNGLIINFNHNFVVNRSNPYKTNEAILVYGDVHGQVNALLFSAATMALFDRPSQPAGSKQGGAFSCLMKCWRSLQVTSAKNDGRIFLLCGRQVADQKELLIFITLSLISMYILHIVLQTIPKILARRICLTLQNFLCMWSFLIFSWP